MASRAEKRAQKELRLHVVRSQFEDLVSTYFLTQGYFLLGKDVQSCIDPVVAPIQSIVTTFYGIQRTIAKGGALTQKRQDDLSHCINQMKALVAALDKSNSIVGEYETYTSRALTFSACLVLGALSLLVGLMYTPALTGAAVLLPIAIVAYASLRSLKNNLDAEAIREIPVLRDDSRPELTRIYYAINDTTGSEVIKIRQDGTGQSFFYADPVAVTCTCSDFIEHRANFEPKEVQRLCVHILKAFDRLGLWPPQEEIVDTLLTFGPLEGGSWSYKTIYKHKRLSGAYVYFGVNKRKDWIDVYARKRRSGEKRGVFTGSFDRYSFNALDRRWSYGKAPPGASEIRKLVDNFL